MDDVQRIATALGRPHSNVVDAAVAHTAMLGLEARGLCLANDTIAFSEAATAELRTGPWLQDFPLARAFVFDGEATLNDVGADISGQQQPQPQRQRIEFGARSRVTGRLLRGLDLIAATQLWHELPCNRRVSLLSGGGAGAGQIWLATPAKEVVRLTNAQWCVAMAARLGLLRCPGGHHVCQLPRGDGGEVCGLPLDPLLQHPGLCGSGPARLRAHRALHGALRAFLERTGAIVDLERCIPELCRQAEGATGVQEAILDAVVRWPGSARVFWIDGTIRNPHAARYRRAEHKPGIAAAAGVADKKRRYGEAVRSLVFEPGGRLAEASAGLLADLAQEASSF